MKGKILLKSYLNSICFREKVIEDIEDFIDRFGKFLGILRYGENKVKLGKYLFD